MNLELLWKTPLFVLVVAWGVYFWSVPSAKHSENMAKLCRFAIMAIPRLSEAY